MAQTQVLDVIQDVAQIVRNAPNTTLIGAYIRAARKFCRETRWMRVSVSGQTTAGVQVYTLGSDPHVEVLGIRAASAARLAGDTKQWTLGLSNTDAWDPNTRPARPLRYAYVPEGQIAIHPTPDAAYALTLKVVVQPKDGATALAEELLVKWDQALQSGALSYLLTISGQPWTNPLLAEQHRRAFQAAINNARADEQREFNAGNAFVRRRPFLVGRV